MEYIVISNEIFCTNLDVKKNNVFIFYSIEELDRFYKYYYPRRNIEDVLIPKDYNLVLDYQLRI